MSFSSLRISVWFVLVVCMISSVYSDPSAIRHFPAPEFSSGVVAAVYRPNISQTISSGLVVHLYGAGGSHTQGRYNVGRPPYELFRRILANRGYWLVIPELGPQHWMNDAAIAKVDAVIKSMIAEEAIDPSKVHLLGTSMGGGSSLLYIMRRPELIESAVVIFPMTDFFLWLEESPGFGKHVERAHAISHGNRKEVLSRISPVRHIDSFSATRLFLLHGSNDTTVFPRHSREFTKAVLERGYTIEYHEAEGAVHHDEIARQHQRKMADFLTLGLSGPSID